MANLRTFPAEERPYNSQNTHHKSVVEAQSLRRLLITYCLGINITKVALDLTLHYIILKSNT